MPGRTGFEAGDFEGGDFEGIDVDSHGLVELSCEERHGLVWVVATAGRPIDLDEHLGPLNAELAQWDLGSYVAFAERTFESSVNWKAAVEAFAENYHFAYVHGQSIIGMNTITNTAVFDTFGPHHRLAFPSPWIEGARGEADPPILGSLSSSTGSGRTWSSPSPPSASRSSTCSPGRRRIAAACVTVCC